MISVRRVGNLWTSEHRPSSTCCGVPQVSMKASCQASFTKSNPSCEFHQTCRRKTLANERGLSIQLNMSDEGMACATNHITVICVFSVVPQDVFCKPPQKNSKSKNRPLSLYAWLMDKPLDAVLSQSIFWAI